MNNLAELLKYCRIKGAILTGNWPEVGPLCEEVNYNGQIIVVETTITAEDIARYSVTTV